MSVLNLTGVVVVMLIASQAVASEWAAIKQGEDTVREIDTGSIVKNGAVVTFVSRHTFVGKSEYKVGRREAKYLQIATRVNCDQRTLAQLATEAHDEKMGLIAKQQINLPQDTPVTKGSIDESMLDYICADVRQQQK